MPAGTRREFPGGEPHWPVQHVGQRANVPDLRDALAEAPLPKFVAVGEHDLWPLRLHRLFAQAIRARIGVYRGGRSPCETSPHEFSRDLLALYGKARDA